MVRNKKKMTSSDFEEHVVLWWAKQIEREQEIVEQLENDRSFCDQERAFVFSCIANELEFYLELISPCVHDEGQLVEWSKEFISQWQQDDFSVEN